MVRAVALALLSALAADPPGFHRPAFKPDTPADIRKAVEAGTAERLDEARSLRRSIDFQEGVVARLTVAKPVPKGKGTKFAPEISAETIAGRLTEATAELAGYRLKYDRVCGDVGFVPADHPPVVGAIGPWLVGPPRPVRVLCYNIHHGEGTDGKVDLPRLAAVIKAADPDLVALQEVDDKTERTGGVDQTAELAGLTGMHGRFGKAIDYQGGGYGQAVLTREPPAEATVHLLPGVPDRERRIAFAVRVSAGGREVLFVTTHLHHQNAAFREQQAAELNKLFAGAARPVILAGDFNATPDAKAVTLLADKWASATADPGLLSFPAEKPVKQIDYVFTRTADRWRASAARVIAEPVASDHRPVAVTLHPGE